MELGEALELVNQTKGTFKPLLKFSEALERLDEVLMIVREAEQRKLAAEKDYQDLQASFLALQVKQAELDKSVRELGISYAAKETVMKAEYDTIYKQASEQHNKRMEALALEFVTQRQAASEEMERARDMIHTLERGRKELSAELASLKSQLAALKAGIPA